MRGVAWRRRGHCPRGRIIIIHIITPIISMHVNKQGKRGTAHSAGQADDDDQQQSAEQHVA